MLLRRATVASASTAAFLVVLNRDRSNRTFAYPQGSTKVSQQKILHELPGGQVAVSLPKSYDADVHARRQLDVVYVTERGGANHSFYSRAHPSLFFDVARAATADHAKVEGAAGRQWHPNLIVVGIRPHSDNPAATMDFVAEWAIPVIDMTYATKPYAAGRAICSSDAPVWRRLLQDDARCRLFRFLLLGNVGDNEDDPPADETPLPDKTQAFLFATESQQAPANALAAALTRRCQQAADTTTMVVDRHGEQRYSTHAADTGGAAVTLECLPAGAKHQGQSGFAARGMQWLGERLERQKLASLGSLLPWHEFK